MSSDTDKSRAFYGELLGWESEATTEEEYGGYINFHVGGDPVGGCMLNNGVAGMPDMWSTYLSVVDAQATCDAAAAAGGTVYMPPMDIGTIGKMSMLGDPGGASIGIWQPVEFPGFTTYAEIGRATWFENHSRDYDKAIPFYRDVFGWDISTMSDTPEFRYSTYSAGGEEMLAGIMDSSNFLPEGVPAHWAIYFSVADADASSAKVVELGGQIVQPAEDTPYGRLVGAVDSTGANFKLMQPPAG
jgi:predicted enzyme related to lactoylglutathione lyase